MRDIALGSVLVWLIARAVIHPWIGVMAWTWVSLMNPHRLSYALANTPVGAAIAAATIFGLLVTKDRRESMITPESCLLIAFTVWTCITFPFSMFPDDSTEMMTRVLKINFMVLISIVLLNSRKHIITFAWVICGSLGFYGVKGGLFTIATGGSYRVWGPEDSFIEGNNEVALALIVIIPLLRFLQLQSPHRWIRRGLSIPMILCAAAALGSHSRGALLAIIAMAGVMLWRSERKIVPTITVSLVAAILIPFMPDNWTTRMETIGEYESDTSAMGRVNAWWMAWNLATRNFFGGGFDIYNAEIFARYAPVPEDVHAAHSIYFQVLGEHGFVGLFLFLLVWLMVWLRAGKLRNFGRELPQTRWVSDLGSMCQVSLAGYFVGGAFLSLAYFDLPYNVLILVTTASRWYSQKAWQRESEGSVAGARTLGRRAA